MIETSVSDEWLENFLTLSTRADQEHALRDAGLYNEQGLSHLLDQAMTLARSDPGKARHLAVVCEDVASAAGVRSVGARAAYVQAQTHAIRGEFTVALDRIRTARKRYEALGNDLEALRTNIGLMHVLNELGRHRDALRTGQEVLDAVEGRVDEFSDSEQALLLAGLAQQNRGVCYETVGRYEDALDVYARAETYFAELGMQDRISDISNNRGIVLVHLGRVSEALEAFDTAETIREEAGLTLLRAQTLNNIGDAYVLQGNYSRGLEAFDEARQIFTSLDALANQQILLRKTADAYLALNLYPEAEDTYREAIALLEDSGMADHHARALGGLGATLVAQAKLSDAEQVLAQSADLFAAADNVPMLCSIMLEQAALYERTGDTDAALQRARDALKLVDGEEWPVERAYANMRVADLLLPDTEAAEPHLCAAQEAGERLALPTLRYRIEHRLGRLRWLQGRKDEAQTLLESAIDQIETLRGTLAHEAVRTSFLRDKTAAYEDLLRVHIDQADRNRVNIEEGFAVAEHAKSRTLVDLLSGVLTPNTSDESEIIDEKLEQLEADLHAVYNEFLATDSASVNELKRRAATLEREISRLRLKTGNHISAIDPLTSPRAFQGIRNAIPSDIVLIAYHIVEDEVLAFVSWGGHLHVVREISNVPAVQSLLQKLYMQWNRFRVGASFVQRHMEQLERSAQRILGKLYDELVTPIENILSSARTNASGPMKLAIVPHGVLHQVPFHALYDGNQYLIGRAEISYAPSATVLALCEQRRRRPLHRALLMGLADPLIPGVNAEIHSISRELSNGTVSADVKLNGNTTRAHLTEATPGCDIVHLACHGMFRADNPMFSALKLADGWLTAADAMQLDVTNAIVTLSACESGRSKVILGDEVLGLPRAFLGAGAATVVVSLWLAQDETTATFMTEWYSGLRQGMGRAAALRNAALALKAEHPHPYYWAPFMLIGQR